MESYHADLAVRLPTRPDLWCFATMVGGQRDMPSGAMAVAAISAPRLVTNGGKGMAPAKVRPPPSGSGRPWR